ncbi:MAG: DUF1697 domain-containing protein [Dehalococcoidia bacterium]
MAAKSAASQSSAAKGPAPQSTRWVAFLRGINVGGINIKMTDLAAVFRDLGFEDVKTVLASGNVLFRASEPNLKLKGAIEQALRTRFGYDAWVILVTVEELRRVVDAFPFPGYDETKQPYVMFLADPKVLADLLAIEDQLDPAVDRLAPGEGVLYWEVTKGETVHSAFSKHSAKPRFKALTTTRNMRTVRKLLG